MSQIQNKGYCNEKILHRRALNHFSQAVCGVQAQNIFKTGLKTEMLGKLSSSGCIVLTPAAYFIFKTRNLSDSLVSISLANILPLMGVQHAILTRFHPKQIFAKVLFLNPAISYSKVV